MTLMLERKTTISTNVLKELQSAGRPISVIQILHRLQGKGLTPNKTTVYRILEKLIKTDEVTEVPVKNAGSYYEYGRKRHHHHFFCDGCERVYCLGACHVDSHHLDLNKLLPNENFSIQSHDFNLYGRCEACND